MPNPGVLMAAEIAEQPAAWRRLSTEGRDQVRAAARRIADYAPRFVLFVARGTSDHAALYAKYLTEIVHQLPAGLVSPSTMTTYGSRPDLRQTLMIAVSQSGGSPDLIQSLQVARERGALTLAVTNKPASPLAEVAELDLDIRAGEEKAVAATKSYTTQLLALYLLLDAVRGGDGSALDGLPDLADRIIADNDQFVRLAERYRFASRLVSTGRGYSYPTAREAALKLMETSYLSAQAFSGADLLHGPLAMIDRQVPVLATINGGHGGAAMLPVLARLRDLGADVCCVGAGEAVQAASAGYALPGQVAEEVSPLLEIIPFQLLALHLSVARGSDPDAPRGLAKVTETL